MGRSHNTGRRGFAFSVVKKVLLAGCMLGVGMVAGAFLIGHQGFMKVSVSLCGICLSDVSYYTFRMENKRIETNF